MSGGGIPLTARRLLTARFWRSIAQGTLVVDLALYLDALHWSGVAIGAVLGVAGIAGAVFGVGIGLASDRSGRKGFLMAYEALCCVCGIMAFSTSRTAPLAAAIVLAGFGRGANGAAGPVAPAEDAWLAGSLEPMARGFVFSLKSALGFGGMALGAMAAMLPALWTTTLGPADRYRPIFLIVVLGNAANLLILARTPERCQEQAPAVDPETRQAPETSRARENQFLLRLVALNVFNGLAAGLTTPLISYWFEQRFHIGPVLIAPVMAATYLAVALAALCNGGLTRHSGLVNIVLWGRSGGLVLLLLFPLMPIYGLAALLHVLRSALNLGTIGARQALVVSAVHDKRRGLASSLNTFSGRIPQSIGPVIAGSFIGAGQFAMPFYLAAVFQGAYVFLFGKLFRQVEHGMKQAKSSEPGANESGLLPG
jgi:MFS family permease